MLARDLNRKKIRGKMEDGGWRMEDGGGAVSSRRMQGVCKAVS